MNELVKDINRSLQEYPFTQNELNNWDTSGLSEAAAKVCLRWIEKAFDAGNFYTKNPSGLMDHESDKQAWLKENNLIPITTT